MYESITYAELKSLPREQKIEALKELKALYSSQKKIAEKLGVNPPNIYNMISRYIKEDTEQKAKKGRIRNQTARSKSGEFDTAGNEQFTGKVNGDEQIRTEAAGNDRNISFAVGNYRDTAFKDRECPDPNDFLISITKELTGEEAQALLTGIGNIFMKNREYRIDIRITEK